MERGGSMKRWVCLILFLLVISAGCSPAQPAPTFAPFPTPIPPTPTATPFALVSAGTPVPLGEAAIGLDNLDRLAQLARWGQGKIVQVAASPAGDLLAVASPLGIHLYDAASYTEQRFIASDASLTSIYFAPDGSFI